MSTYTPTPEDDTDPFAPTVELREAAFVQLGESYAVRQHSIQAIQDKIATLSTHEQDQFHSFFQYGIKDYIRYLRGCKFIIEKTWKKMCKTLEFHKKHPEFSEEITAQEFQALDQVVFQLTRKDPDGRSLYALRSKSLLTSYHEHTKDLPPHFLARLNIYMFQQFTHDPYIQVHGVGLMNTFRDISMWDTMTLTSITPVNERTAVFHYLQHCTPLRIGHVYIIEEPFYIRWVFNMASIVLSKKLMERFHLINRDYDFLANHLQLSCCQFSDHQHGPQCLPVCLGGEGPDEAVPWIPLRMKAEEAVENNAEVQSNQS